MLRTCSRIIGLTAMVAAPSMTAQAETLALRCEGAKITTEIKDPGIKELFPKQSVGEEDCPSTEILGQEAA
jgi:hypothetical protein